MAAGAKVMESIMILDDDDTEELFQSTLHPQATSCASSTFEVEKTQSTHILESPFASAKKKSHVLKIENEKLFSEFVDHCSAHAQEHPEVVTFLQTKYSKASPEFLMSVEFRNALGRCLTRAQKNSTKIFVYINELCTMLKQHSAKRRALLQPCNAKKQENNESTDKEEKAGKEDECTSKVVEGEERKTKRASKRQIAYLENLLMLYNDEIKRLQQRDLGLEDLEMEDSNYIQEHKLKRKIIKIYNKLCEIKGCSTLTGRVLEQRIPYNGTRYPEINKKIERFINQADVQLNPPDYGDILQVVKRANEKYQLVLSHKKQVQIAQDVFRETGNKLQERRHLDMVYNFGSHLTDLYKPTTDPALSDTVLAQKLRTNRTVALANLEKVISTYANKQDDTEEEERQKRVEKERERKENGQQTATKIECDKTDGKKQQEEEEQEEEEEEEAEEEVEEEEEEEEDASSDSDIEEELLASTEQVGQDDDDNEDELLNSCYAEEQTNDGLSPLNILSSHDAGESGEESPLSVNETEISLNGQHSIESPSLSEIPNQPGTIKNIASEGHLGTMPNGNSDVANNVSTNQSTENFQVTKLVSCSTSTLSTELIKSTGISKKRKRESNVQNNIARNSMSDDHSNVEVTCVRAYSTRADTPNQDTVSSSCSTPPPKKNKVNVSTQCDPEEVIILSDSD